MTHTENEVRLTKEMVVLSKLVDTLLGAGLELTINNGEEVTVRRSKDRTEVLTALRTTDEETLIAHRDGRYFGCCFLVYGNAPWEVVCDNSTSLETFLAEYQKFTDAMADLG